MSIGPVSRDVLPLLGSSSNGRPKVQPKELVSLTGYTYDFLSLGFAIKTGGYASAEYQVFSGEFLDPNQIHQTIAADLILSVELERCYGGTYIHPDDKHLFDQALEYCKSIRQANK